MICLKHREDNYGLPGIGYKKHHLPKPIALMPVYTFVDLDLYASEEGQQALHMCFGPDIEAHFSDYNVIRKLDAEYPPCYIVCGKDDTTVAPYNSEVLAERLDALGIPNILEEGDHAPHGFGDGTGTDVEGWPERAIVFIQELS